MVLTGKVNLFPSGGQLQYRVLDAAGQQIGAGSIPVGGVPGGRGSFNASLTFTEPVNGGTIQVVLSEPDRHRRNHPVCRAAATAADPP